MVKNPAALAQATNTVRPKRKIMWLYKISAKAGIQNISRLFSFAPLLS